MEASRGDLEDLPPTAFSSSSVISAGISHLISCKRVPKDDFPYHLPQFSMIQLPSPFSTLLKWSSWQEPEQHILPLVPERLE